MYKGHTVLMLHQVDNFLISCKLKSVSKQIYDYIGNKLQLHKELVAPFKYFGPAKDYNGVDINQTKHYIEISCPGYIDCVNRAHGWEHPGPDKITSQPTLPMPERALDVIYKDQGPLEGSPEYRALQNSYTISILHKWVPRLLNK